jgi:hypothetical protein
MRIPLLDSIVPGKELTLNRKNIENKQEMCDFDFTCFFPFELCLYCFPLYSGYIKIQKKQKKTATICNILLLYFF